MTVTRASLIRITTGYHLAVGLVGALPPSAVRPPGPPALLTPLAHLHHDAVPEAGQFSALVRVCTVERQHLLGNQGWVGHHLRRK